MQAQKCAVTGAPITEGTKVRYFSMKEIPLDDLSITDAMFPNVLNGYELLTTSRNVTYGNLPQNNGGRFSDLAEHAQDGHIRHAIVLENAIAIILRATPIGVIKNLQAEDIFNKVKAVSTALRSVDMVPTFELVDSNMEDISPEVSLHIPAEWRKALYRQAYGYESPDDNKSEFYNVFDEIRFMYTLDELGRSLTPRGPTEVNEITMRLQHSLNSVDLWQSSRFAKRYGALDYTKKKNNAPEFISKMSEELEKNGTPCSIAVLMPSDGAHRSFRKDIIGACLVVEENGVKKFIDANETMTQDRFVTKYSSDNRNMIPSFVMMSSAEYIREVPFNPGNAENIPMTHKIHERVQSIMQDVDFKRLMSPPSIFM